MQNLPEKTTARIEDRRSKIASVAYKAILDLRSSSFPRRAASGAAHLRRAALLQPFEFVIGGANAPGAARAVTRGAGYRRSGGSRITAARDYGERPPRVRAKQLRLSARAFAAEPAGRSRGRRVLSSGRQPQFAARGVRAVASGRTRAWQRRLPRRAETAREIHLAARRSSAARTRDRTAGRQLLQDRSVPERD